MPERFSSSAENREEERKTLEGVIFVKTVKPDGAVEWRSSEPSRKIAIIKVGEGPEPEEGMPYAVEILEDTDPEHPDAGKFIVRIAEGGVPLTNKREGYADEFPLPIEVDEERGKVAILETELPLNRERGVKVPRRESFRHFTLDERTLLTVEKIATAAELREPCLLEGETSTSKTSSIEFLAMMTGNEVVRMNLNGQTDTSELIGKFVPNDGELQIKFEDALRRLDLLTEQSRDILTRANKEGRGLTLIESQKVAQNEGIKAPDWRWQDGLDIEAKKKGQWLILDEINLAEPQILERLNSQLEKRPSLTVSENGGTVIRELNNEEREKWQKGELPGTEPLHPNFRIFGTMNPAEYSGRAAMSPAYKDRWTSYKFVEHSEEKDYRAMLELMVFGEQPAVALRGKRYRGEERGPLFPALAEVPGMRGFCAKLAKFQVTVEDLARRREIGKNRKEKHIFTRRGLMEFLEYCAIKSFADRKTGKTRTIREAPKEIVLRALEYYYLDKIADKDDRKKVKDQLDAIGIGEGEWTHSFAEPPSDAGTKSGKKEGASAETPGEKPPEKEKGAETEFAPGDRVRVKEEEVEHPGETGTVKTVEKVLGPKDEIVIVRMDRCGTPHQYKPEGLTKLESGTGEKKEKGRKLEYFGRKPVELSDAKELKEFHLGDLLQKKAGISLREEIMEAKKIEVVGFTRDGSVVKQIDDGFCIEDPPEETRRFFERIRGTPEKIKETLEFMGIDGGMIRADPSIKEREGYKVGDKLRPRPGAGLRPEVYKSKNLSVVGFADKDEMIVQTDHGCITSLPSARNYDVI